MKKIKFMLLSLALLAVVGGALAFKARYTQDFCSTTAFAGASGSTCINGGNISCPNRALNSTTTDVPDLDPGVYYCTTVTFGNGFTCTSLNAQQQVITTTCASPIETTVSINN